MNSKQVPLFFKQLMFALVLNKRTRFLKFLHLSEPISIMWGVCVYLCVCVCVYMRACATEAKRGYEKIFSDGVTGSYRLPRVDTGNRIGVLWENSKCC